MKDDTLDIIQKIQEARNPKYFLWNILKDVEWYCSKKYPYLLFGKKENCMYFNYNVKIYTLYYDYWTIYEILTTKYNLNEYSINKLLVDMMSEHFKLRVDTTNQSIYREII